MVGEVFKKRTSLLTKTMQVVRFYDVPHNTLVPLPAARRVSVATPIYLPWTARAEDAASQDFCSFVA